MQLSRQLAVIAVALAVALSMGTTVAFTSPGNVGAMDGDQGENETNATTTTVEETDGEDETTDGNETLTGENETTTGENETTTGEDDETTTFGESFQITSVEVDSSVEPGEPLTLTTTITNPNDVTTGQFVELRIGGVLVEFGEMTLDPGESVTLQFSVPTEGLEEGLYVVGVLARTDGQVSVVAVGVEEPPDDATNVTEPEDNVTNVTEPDDNVTNVTEPVDNETNVTEPDDNVTEPDDNVTNVTEPEDNETNVTEPDDNETNVTEPEDNVTAGNASFEVVGFDAPESAETGENVTVTVEVTNPNDVEVTQDVQFRVFGNLVESQAVTLGPAENRNVTFTLETEGLPPGEYIHGVLTEEFGAVAVLDLTEGEDAADGNVTDDDVTDDNVTDDNVTDAEDNVTDDNVTDDNVTEADNETNVTVGSEVADASVADA